MNIKKTIFYNIMFDKMLYLLKNKDLIYWKIWNLLKQRNIYS